MYNNKQQSLFQKRNIMSKVKITASIPTSHTMNALSKFGLNNKANVDGTVTGELEFNSIEEAKAHLVARAEMHLDTEGELKDALNEINNYNYLRLSDVTADIEEMQLTYDIVFNSNESSNNKGFATTIEDCKSYIKKFNGTNESYFEDYKGGIVSIYCNETEETVFETEVL